MFTLALNNELRHGDKPLSTFKINFIIVFWKALELSKNMQ